MTLFDIPQAAKELRFAPITIRRMIRAGKIPHHKLGGKYFFTPDDLNTYLELAAVPAKSRGRAGRE
jgi:excisionase family DNA binding protein